MSPQFLPFTLSVNAWNINVYNLYHSQKNVRTFTKEIKNTLQIARNLATNVKKPC